MSRKRRSRRRNRKKLSFSPLILIKIGGAFLLFLIVLFVVGTRSMILKPILLSKINAATNLEWECESLSYWPTSGLTIRNAKAIDTKFMGTLFQCDKLSINSPGFVIFNKNIKISKLEAKGLNANIVTLKDGTSNLDNFKKSFAYRQPVQNDLRDFSFKNVNIEDVNITWATENSQSHWTKKGFSNISIKSSEWSRGKTGNFEVDLVPTLSIEKEINKVTDQYSCEIKLVGGFRLNSKGLLTEASLKGSSEQAKASGIYSSSNGHTYKLNAEFKNDLLAPCLLTVLSPYGQEFQFSSSGKLDLVKVEANQIVNYSGSLSVLNPLIGDRLGHFSSGGIQGRSTFFATLFGNSWVTTHEAKVDKAAFIYNETSLPILSGNFTSQIALEKNIKSLRVDSIDLDLNGGVNNLIKIKNEGAMNFSYGPNKAGFETSKLNAEIRSDLQQWTSILPGYIKGGQINLNLSALVNDDGKEIKWSGTSDNSNIILQSQNDPSKVEDYNIRIKTSGPIIDLKTIEHGILEISLLKQGERKAYSRTDLLYLGKERGYTVLLDLDFLDLNHLSKMVDTPFIEAPEGDLRITTSYSTVEKGLQKWSMNLDTKKLGGIIGDRRIEGARVESGFVLSLRDESYTIQNARFDLRFGPRLALSLNGNLNQNFPQNTIDGRIGLLSFNQEVAMLLMPSWLTGLRIIDLAVSGEIDIKSEPKSDEIVFKTEIELERFRNRGFTRVDYRTLPFKINLETDYLDELISIKSAIIDFSPDIQSGDNKLSLSKPLELRFSDGKISRINQNSISFSSEQLQIIQWIDFIDQWREINSQQEVQVAKRTIPELGVQLNVKNFFNGSRFIGNWDRQTSISDLTQLPDQIAHLLPEKEKN